MGSELRSGDSEKSDSQTKVWSEKQLLRSRGYIMRDTLGEGTYSKVKRACSVRLQRDIAIKIICRDKAPDIFQEKFLPREIEILSQIRHPHIIKVYEIFETKIPKRVYIVTELLNSGDLLEHVKAHGSVCEVDTKRIFGDVCQALFYLHDNRIAHRDIKCENILLHRRTKCGSSIELIAKLCDFGFARKFSKQYCTVTEEKIECVTTTFCGSAAYASPEILERKVHNPMLADVWSLGIVLFIALYGAMPFDDKNIRAMLARQKRGDVVLCRTENVSRLAQDLAARTLRPNPKHRPFVKALLRHPWFNETSSREKYKNDVTKKAAFSC